MKAVLILSAIILTVVVSTNSRWAGSSARVEPLPARTAEATLPTLPNTPKNLDHSDEAPLDIQVILLALRAEGFEPQEMQVPAGDYLFVIRNRSGVDEVKLNVRRETGEQLSNGRAIGKWRDWKQRVKLTPGTYVVNASNHPDWTCRIIVER